MTTTKKCEHPACKCTVAPGKNHCSDTCEDAKKTKALTAHEEFGEALPSNPGEKLAQFAKAGIDTEAVAAQLLEEGVASFAKSWKDLLDCIASKSQVLKAA